MHRPLLVTFTALIAVGLVAASPGRPTVIPENGFVPDEATAIRIAEAVWIPIYGEAKIRAERPFQARLENGVWTVTGSLPEGWRGGVAEADISKRDGTILRVIHGK